MMRRTTVGTEIRAIVMVMILFLAAATSRGDEPVAPPRLQPIDLKPFASGIHHWRNLRDETRFIKVEPDQPSYPADSVGEIVANILLFQRDDGGWPKDYDMTAVLTPEQRGRVVATRAREDASYDNGNIHSQVEYLAHATARTSNPAWRAACERGIDFMLRSQYARGGFPQRYPHPTGYHAHITFNDGVMIGALKVLNNAAEGATHFNWLDDTRRGLARTAVERGVDCILRCQIRVDGRLTGWCQQHDEHTFEARPARTFELASLCPQETTEIVHFLMRRPDPSSEIVRAVNSAVDWLERVRLTGVRVEKVKSTPEKFLRHDTDSDVVVRADPNAKPIWARHYEIGTNRPIFAGRDGIKKYELAGIERERRTGTPWYGHWPSVLIERDYPAWLDQRTRR